MVSSKISTAIVISSLINANAFVQQPISSKKAYHHHHVAGHQALLSMSNHNNDESAEMSRRVAFTKSAATFASIASIATGNPGFAFAAKAPPTTEELNRIKTGYERMSYLLENFDQETTICRVRFGVI